MDLSHVTDFFLLRKKVTGGFGASPGLPATIEDTYYALRSLRALEENGLTVPLSAFSGHERFLLEKLKETDLSYRSRFQLLWCLNFFSIRLPSHLLSDQRDIKKRNLGLEDVFYLRRMGFSYEGGFEASRYAGAIKTVRDLRMFLYCSGGSISSSKRARWLDWLSRCQNPDGGLGFMPGTTSFIENCYYGLRASELLGDMHLDLEGISTFILSTKSGQGGFGRRNLGVPFPSSTWHGVGSLSVSALLTLHPNAHLFSNFG